MSRGQPEKYYERICWQKQIKRILNYLNLYFSYGLKEPTIWAKQRCLYPSLRRKKCEKCEKYNEELKCCL